MINDFEVSLLSKEELETTNIIKNVYSTDFARLLGADMDKFCYGFCHYWCKTNYPYSNSIDVVDEVGHFSCQPFYEEQVAIRPALKYSEIERYITYCHYDQNHKIDYVEFGEYPQSLEYDLNIQEELEKLYKKNKLNKTGKTYTTDSTYADNSKKNLNEFIHVKRLDFIPYKHEEYEYEGNRYIRVTGYKHALSHYYFDTTATSFLDVFWVKVEPIKWKVDYNNDIALADRALLSGIQFHYNIFAGDIEPVTNVVFEDTSMYKYLNTYFVKDILPKKLLDKINNSNDDSMNISYNEMISKKFK